MPVKKQTKGALIIFFLLLIVIVAFKLIKPMLFERGQRATSDATRSSLEIRIAGDDYIGYWFMNSPQMKKMAARQGLSIVFTNEWLYADRLEKFSKGMYDCIVLPVNSYLLHGLKHKYPGVIVAAISESRGADAIAGFNVGSKIDVNSLNDASKKFVYVPDSPSSFLLDLIINDFDLDQLKNSDSWRMEVNTPEEIIKAAKEGKGDYYVTWDPTLSRILEMEGMSYVFGSDKFRGYIIDVFVFHREFLKNHRDKLIDFFSTYFRVLTSYASSRDEMIDGMNKSTKISKNKLEDIMLKRVEWFDLDENCNQLFGVSLGSGTYTKDGITDCILACTEVMVNSKYKSIKFDSDPLRGDPYLIINNSVLEDIAKKIIITPTTTANTQIDFNPLNDQQWRNLQPVGVFKVMDIVFQSWDNKLSPEGIETVDKTAAMLVNNYPNYRIIVRGHTAPGGDEKVNAANSLERAKLIAQRLIGVYNINPNRIHAEGVGSSMKPQEKAGETPRQYQYRLTRVEFIAVQDNPF